ncbi:hypothetical protein Glove_87g204 [Diversispora epigaea]|uniref:Uncharacterized protein n=1 Tax=Diversispora epigaea TaxID=1348612 RepID=A0A397J8C5_9GLOM|nr:hypothetical protein Glove_87g204 [Diversispora epigaea]
MRSLAVMVAGSNSLSSRNQIRRRAEKEVDYRTKGVAACDEVKVNEVNGFGLLVVIKSRWS